MCRTAGESQQEDLHLIDLYLKGEIGAFAKLVDKYGELLLLNARRKVYDSHFAEDVVQRTWLWVLVHMKDYTPDRCTFLGWLKMILVSRAIDFLRQEYTTQERGAGQTIVSFDSRSGDSSKNSEQHPTGIQVAIGTPGPSQEMEDQELSMAVDEAIESLTEEERNILFAIHYSTLLQKEIADLLGYSDSKITRMKKKIYDKIRQHLRKRGFD